jgi:hypothetical protein
MLVERARAKIEAHYPSAVLRFTNSKWIVVDGVKEIGPKRNNTDDATLAAAALIPDAPNQLEYTCGCVYPTTEASHYYDHQCAACYRWAAEGGRIDRVIHDCLAIE